MGYPRVAHPSSLWAKLTIMTSFVKYSATQGIPWERLIIVRDRRTHRVRRPVQCWARIKTGTLTVAPITTTITSEGGILLSLTAEQTKDLPVGELKFDVMAVMPKYQVLTATNFASYEVSSSTETITEPVARGVLTVSALDTVTSLEENDQVEIRFKQGEDYRLVYSWTDSDGELVAVQDAYMQAKDVEGNVIMTISWFNTAPNEATIAAMTNTERGYLAPFTGSTMELHISNLNDFDAGAYTYDVFVQETDNDWKPLVAGNLIIEESVSTRPA